MDKLAARKIYLCVNKDIKEKNHSDLLITWKQFLEHCQQSVEDYNRRPHSSLPKITDQETGRRRHMSPLEMLAWHISRGWKMESVQFDQNAIDTLFMPMADATVIRSTVSLCKTFITTKRWSTTKGNGYGLLMISMMRPWCGSTTVKTE